MFLRDSFANTESVRGTYITLLCLDLFVTILYLIWTIYLWSGDLFGLVGFLILCFIIFIELFGMWASVNEAGFEVKRAVADFALARSGNYDSLDYQASAHLMACLIHTNIEIRGIGGLVFRFRLAITVFGGIIVSIIPRVVLR
jgi:hypothetical protein